jgi:tRNA-splicing ligase RtcB (3'-phosphate/5'-hydroxy nucleic acid ligase)
MTMKGYQLEALGLPAGNTVELALKLVGKACTAGMKATDARDLVGRIARDPGAYLDDPHFGELAHALGDRVLFFEREAPAPYAVWGVGLDPGAIDQMKDASRLPVSHRGALMPDAHRGYGLPIGGVLATRNAVIPFAVGVDIACRMKLTVLDLAAEAIESDLSRLSAVLEEETRFGMGASFDEPHDHDVMDANWSVSPITKKLKDRAWHQLGTSGSGNHFVEFGTLTLEKDDLGLSAGTYLALLSHSGSRGAGANVAHHYSKLAESLHPELPRELRHLAWLDLSSEVGQEYWAAMELMGEYASANHAVIHRSILEALGAEALVQVENHHNFAWKEVHDAEELIVHRKGATPAGLGVLGVIPGSMADPGFVVRGKGNALSLESAAHGAGRQMSRTQANRELRWNEVNAKLSDRGVTLLSAGLDEAPFAYKDIEEVMSHQEDLVEIVARFDPKIVKMAPAGEPAED